MIANVLVTEKVYDNNCQCLGEVEESKDMLKRRIVIENDEDTAYPCNSNNAGKEDILQEKVSSSFLLHGLPVSHGCY